MSEQDLSDLVYGTDEDGSPYTFRFKSVEDTDTILSFQWNEYSDENTTFYYGTVQWVSIWESDWSSYTSQLNITDTSADQPGFYHIFVDTSVTSGSYPENFTYGLYSLTRDPSDPSSLILLLDPYYDQDPWRISGPNDTNSYLFQLETADQQFLQLYPCCTVMKQPDYDQTGMEIVTTDDSSIIATGANTTDRLSMPAWYQVKAGLSTGAKAGIGVGVSVAVLLVLGVIFFFIRRMRISQKSYPIKHNSSFVPFGQPPLIVAEKQESGSPNSDGPDITTTELNQQNGNQNYSMVENPHASAVSNGPVPEFYELSDNDRPAHELDGKSRAEAGDGKMSDKDTTSHKAEDTATTVEVRDSERTEP